MEIERFIRVCDERFPEISHLTSRHLRLNVKSEIVKEKISFFHMIPLISKVAVANPGYLVGEGTNSWGRGANPKFMLNILNKIKN